MALFNDSLELKRARINRHTTILIAVALAVGALFLGCTTAASADKAGGSMNRSNGGKNPPPDLGLKKVRLSKVDMPTRSKAPEAKVMQTAASVFNTPVDDTGPVLPNAFSAKIKSFRSDKAGNQHARATQWYKGLRVVGAEIIVHMNSAGKIFLVNGRYLPPGSEVAVRPSIDEKAALAVGMKHHGGGMNIIVEKSPELVIYAKRLAYHYIISHQGAGGGIWYYYVDAATGQTIFRFNNLQTE